MDNTTNTNLPETMPLSVSEKVEKDHKRFLIVVKDLKERNRDTETSFDDFASYLGIKWGWVKVKDYWIEAPLTPTIPKDVLEYLNTLKMDGTPKK
jgi:hypothetical protein